MFDPAYFDPGYFLVIEPAAAAGAALASAPYFDPAYFDPAYFLTADAAPGGDTATGTGGRLLPPILRRIPTPDDDELLALMPPFRIF